MTIRPATAPPSPAPIDPLLDHLVYATPDLSATLAEFRARTGLDPAEGGRHIGLGTRNYLIGLGPRRYLEIIGPDTENPAAPGVSIPFGIDALTEPRLLTWAVHPADIDSAVAASAAAGVDLGAVRDMRRARPDGVVLAWRLASPLPLPLEGVAPFVIDWRASPHPADGDAPRADLLALRARHPDVAAVQRVFDALGVHVPVDRGPVRIIATVDTPRGVVELG